MMITKEITRVITVIIIKVITMVIIKVLTRVITKVITRMITKVITRVIIKVFTRVITREITQMITRVITKVITKIICQKIMITKRKNLEGVFEVREKAGTGATPGQGKGRWRQGRVRQNLLAKKQVKMVYLILVMLFNVCLALGSFLSDLYFNKI